MCYLRKINNLVLNCYFNEQIWMIFSIIPGTILLNVMSYRLENQGYASHVAI